MLDVVANLTWLVTDITMALRIVWFQLPHPTEEIRCKTNERWTRVHEVLCETSFLRTDWRDSEVKFACLSKLMSIIN